TYPHPLASSSVGCTTEWGLLSSLFFPRRPDSLAAAARHCRRAVTNPGRPGARRAGRRPHGAPGPARRRARSWHGRRRILGIFLVRRRAAPGYTIRGPVAAKDPAHDSDPRRRTGERRRPRLDADFSGLLRPDGFGADGD